MKILITGGAGFIGSNFVCKALQKNHEIINVDKLTYAGNLNNLNGYTNHPLYHFYKNDICDRDAFQKILLKHQPDVILHTAAESHVDRSIDCADDFIHTNINGTYNLLYCAYTYYKNLTDQSRFRFIHLSTDEVFGALGDTGSFDETMPYRPNSPYAASKASSDLLVRSYMKTYNFPAIIVNASNNYGPKQYPEKLIPLMTLNAMEGKSLPLYGDGRQIRDWLYVEDHVGALFSLIDKGHIGESYCIGADNEISNKMLVESLCSILDDIAPKATPHKDLITYVKDRPGHDFRYATNASKLKNHTGWSPKTDFKVGLRKTIEWYVDQFETMSLNENARQRIGLSV